MPSRWTLAARACGVAMVATLIGAGWAAAARLPTTTERKNIVRAVKNSSLTAMVPDDEYKVRGVRITTMTTPGRRYGRIVLVPDPGSHRDGATGVVTRRNGHWRLTDLGTSGVGCRLPAAVRADLRFDRECP